MSLKPHEEIDLIIGYSGYELRKQALSINVGDPFIGLIRLWKRLDKPHGTPELVECSLKKKLANLQNITRRDPKRLYEA